MTKFEHLVPSLEVCNLIPKNSPFQDSVLVWHKVKDTPDEYIIAVRQNKEDIPAPTLAEILEAVPKSSTGKYPAAGWYDVEAVWDIRCFVPGNLLRVQDVNAAEAALKLWSMANNFNKKEGFKK